MTETMPACIARLESVARLATFAKTRDSIRLAGVRFKKSTSPNVTPPEKLKVSFEELPFTVLAAARNAALFA
jgi:hypothetical protein